MIVHRQTIGEIEYQLTDLTIPEHSASRGTICYNNQGFMYVNTSVNGNDTYWRVISPQVSYGTTGGVDDGGFTFSGLNLNTLYAAINLPMSRSINAHTSGSSRYALNVGGQILRPSKFDGVWDAESSIYWKNIAESDLKVVEMSYSRTGSGYGLTETDGATSKGYIYQTSPCGRTMNLNRYEELFSTRNDFLWNTFRLIDDGNASTNISLSIGNASQRVTLMDPFPTAFEETFDTFTVPYTSSAVSNNWYFANDPVHQWVVSSSISFSGSNSLYISETGSAYANTMTGSIGGQEYSHVWREFYVPDVNLDKIYVFYRSKHNGSIGTEELNTYLAPNTEAQPVAGTLYSSSYLIKNDVDTPSNAWEFQSIEINATSSYAGTTQRLIFSYDTNGNNILFNPPPAIDHVKVLFKTK